MPSDFNNNVNSAGGVEFDREVMNTKLLQLHEGVKKATPGMRLGFVLSNYPPLIVVCTCTGWEIDDEGKRTVTTHLRIRGEDHLLSPPQITARSFHSQGWEWLNEKGDPGFTYDEYLAKMNNMHEKIDNSIRKDHGIVVHRNGCVEDNNIGNCFVLHIVDIFLCFFHGATMGEDTQPSVHPSMERELLKGEISPGFANDFMHGGILSSDDFEFLKNNLEIFIVIYALWGNQSMLPIRVKDDASIIFTGRRARKILHDRYFLEIQEMKLNELERTMTTPAQLIYFALI